jgi:hypothetical protein
MDKKNLRGQIHNSMYQNIQKKGFVAPVDVLMDIGVLSIKNYEDWRFGKVAFLEKECRVSLHMLSEIMREIRAYAKDNHLKPSWTCYHQWGKHKDRKLRFSKSNDEKIEYNYATHFIDINAVERKRHPPPDQGEEN